MAAKAPVALGAIGSRIRSAPSSRGERSNDRLSHPRGSPQPGVNVFLPGAILQMPECKRSVSRFILPIISAFSATHATMEKKRAGSPVPLREGREMWKYPSNIFFFSPDSLQIISFPAQARLFSNVVSHDVAQPCFIKLPLACGNSPPPARLRPRRRLCLNEPYP